MSEPSSRRPAPASRIAVASAPTRPPRSPSRRPTPRRPRVVAQRGHLPGLPAQLRRRRTATAPATSPASDRASRYLRDLGVDAIWFTPWYVSPLADGGYDVADYRAIDPAFGTLEEAEALIAEAPRLGIRTIVDIVPNHVSDRASRGSRRRSPPAPARPERARFWFRAGPRAERRRDADRAGGRTSRARPGPARPTPTARPASGTCTCSLGPAAGPQLGPPGRPARARGHPRASGSTAASPASGSTRRPCWSRTRRCPRIPGDPRPPASTRTPTATSSTTIYRGWRAIADSYPGTRVLVGEVWLPDVDALRAVPAPRRAAHRLQLRLHGPAVGRRRAARVDRRDARGARARRRAGDLGAVQPRRHPAGDPLRPRGHLVRLRGQAPRASRPTSTSAGVGPARRPCSPPRCPARSTSTRATSSAWTRSQDLPADQLQDPMHFRSGGVDPGRDGCRVPLPWSGAEAPFGFSPDGAAAATVAAASRPAGRDLTVEAQEADPRLDAQPVPRRAAHPARRARPRRRAADLAAVAATACSRSRAATGSCASPTSRRPPSPLPADGDVLLASAPLDGRPAAGRRHGLAPRRPPAPGRRPARRQGTRHEEELTTTRAPCRRHPAVDQQPCEGADQESE